MRKLLSFIIGLGAGIGSGMLLVTFFSPVSGDELRQNLRDHYQNALKAAQEASEAKRRELEAELETMREGRNAAEA
ncbi:MAG: YtxH domain-containing protein [Anaerolineae bacterium]|nr:YtxH domain-containing protein [Anaerolineae bacterium]